MSSSEDGQAKPDKAQGLREEIEALTRQKDSAMRNIQEMEAKMDEIKTGPNTPNIQEINLKLLNQYQEEKVRMEERYKKLGKDIAGRRVDLQDISN